MQPDADAVLSVLRRQFVERLANERATCREALAELHAGGGRREAALRELRSLAHGLAGAGGTFGFPRVSEAAADLEAAAEAALDATGGSRSVVGAAERLLSIMAECGR